LTENEMIILVANCLKIMK